MVESSALTSQEIVQRLQQEKDWHRSAVFTDKGQILSANKCNLLPEEIKFYLQAFDDRDTTVGEGFFINNEHFDVHRFHPPLIYGRRGGPDEGEGIALCRISPRTTTGAEGEKFWFLLITYLLPILSAKAVPQMVKFSETNLGTPQ